MSPLMPPPDVPAPVPHILLPPPTGQLFSGSLPPPPLLTPVLTATSSVLPILPASGPMRVPLAGLPPGDDRSSPLRSPPWRSACCPTKAVTLLDSTFPAGTPLGWDGSLPPLPAPAPLISLPVGPSSEGALDPFELAASNSSSLCERTAYGKTAATWG